MAQLAIDVLWLLVGIIILAGVVWFAIWVIESFVHPIPEIVKRGIWVIILILVIIMAIATLVGGSSGMRGPAFWADDRPLIGGTMPPQSDICKGC